MKTSRLSCILALPIASALGACSGTTTPGTGDAGPLVGTLRAELPCTSPGGSVNCPAQPDGGTAVVATFTLPGTAGQTYNVTMRVRGEVEERTYSGADGGIARGAEADGGVSPELFVAGAPNPSHGDTFNVYELDISSPAQTYFLNSGMSGINNTWLIDYLATIPIAAGATLTLTADTIEGVETVNVGPDGNPIVVPGVSPAPASFVGQFVQIDLQSMTAAH